MDLEELCLFCMRFPEVEETVPFGPDILVYKVCGKAFALTGVDDVPARVNLKCDPVRAEELRDEYDAVIPGYHMNKRHWNTVVLDGSLGGDFVESLVKDSYDLVVAGLKKADRERLQSLRDDE